jgi:hypothetical protein
MNATPATGPGTAGTAPQQQAGVSSGTPGVSLPAGTFSPVPAAMPYGRVLTDISHTWDGVLHAIDDQGAPYMYDRAGQAWNPVGTGIDAAVLVGNTIYHFRGPEFVTSQYGANQISAPVPIAQKWPSLPRSFQQGVCGAASLNGHLYLFAHGRYVCVDEPSQVYALADLRGWPTSPAWAGGVIDGTLSMGGDQVMVFRNGEWVTFSISTGAITAGFSVQFPGTYGPLPLIDFSAWIAWLPASVFEGFRGGFSLREAHPEYGCTLYAGPRVVTNTAVLPGTSFQVINPPAVYQDWPDAWNPLLAHAFTGKSGALWSATKAGQLVSLEADGFHSTSQQASQVSAGRDGSVYYVDQARTSVHALDNPGTPVYTSPAPIKQLSHGRAAELWVLDEQGNTSRVTTAGPGAAPATQPVFQAQAISANADGSVWHIGPDGQPARYTDTTGASETFPGAPTAGLVSSNSAGHGYLVARTPAGAPDALTIHEYTSPFVFKTVGMPAVLPYASVIYGGGRVFYLTGDDASSTVIACDYESGEVVWSKPSPAGGRWLAAGYSDTLDCLAINSHAGIYLFQASDGTAHETIDDDDSYGVDSFLVTGNSAVAVTANTVISYDLGTKEATVIDNEVAAEGVPAVPPVVTGNSVIFMAFGLASDQPGVGIINTGFYPEDAIWSDAGSAVNNGSVLLAPITSESFTADQAVFFVDGNGNIRAVSTDGNEKFAVSPTELIGQQVQVTSRLTYANGCIWFGCTITGQGGALVGLDARNGLSLVPHTPFFPDVNATAVPTKPLFYRNAQGQPLVVFGTRGAAKLWAFNPVDGSSGSIDTMGTEIGALTDDAPLGIVCCSGTPPVATPTALTSYYGIRLDSIPLTSPPRYSLVADSQLMQDPDQQATNKGTTTQGKSQDGTSTAPLIPPSVARYQTHITVVDSLRTPVPGLDVKLYVDQATAGVPLTVQGQQVTVPPSGAVVATDTAGKITVVSDATDVATAALRVWAPFMDNSERVVIHPDHEFHQRVMTAHANAGDDDPGKVNLVTAYDYNGNPFFTDQEKTSNAPQQTATAVQQMGTATGLNGGTAGSAALGGPQAGRAKYLTYADMGGAAYYPADTIAQRPLAPPAAAFALHVQRAADGSLAHNVLSLKDAGAVLDGWGQYGSWTPPSTAGGAVGAGTLGGWWDDFWGWVCGEVEQVADVIQQVVVTVAEDVRVAIQVLVEGATKVFDWVVNTVEDAVHAIGSFFIQLGKLIMKVIEALSLLFNFKEIMHAHDLLQQLLNRWVNGDGSAANPGLASAITKSAVPALNTFILQLDKDVGDLFSKLKLTSNPPISQLQGQGSTEHDAYQVTPAAGGSSPSPVQGSWASDKMKQNMPQAVPGKQAGAAAGVADGSALQPLVAFVDGLVTTLGSGDLASAATELKTRFEGLFQAASLEDFLAKAVDVLLSFIQLLVEAVVTLAGAVVVGALDAIASVIDGLWDALSDPIDIPFLSWLYQELTGQQFTILGAGLFLVAAPVAIMFRALTGKNPSEVVLTPEPGVGAALGAASPDVQKVCTLAGLFAGLLGGLLGGAMGMSGTGGEPFGATVVAAFGLIGVVISTPYISSDNPASNKIVQWALSISALFAPAMLAYYAWQKPADKDEEAQLAGAKDVMAFGGCVIGVISLLTEIALLLDSPPALGTEFGIALGMAATLPPIVGIIKMKAINDGFLDGLGGPIAGAVKLIDTFAIFVCKMLILASS